MLADAIVYALSLMAAGTAVATKKKVAKISGLLQMLLALVGFSEVIRRFFYSETMPDFKTMIIVAAVALVANVVCLWLIQKARSEEALRIRASPSLKGLTTIAPSDQSWCTTPTMRN